MSAPRTTIADRLDNLNRVSSRFARSVAMHRPGTFVVLLGMIVRPPVRFLRRFVLKGSFQDGLNGYIDARFDSFEAFIANAKRWENRLSADALKTAKP